jgi:hypothetical protein
MYDTYERQRFKKTLMDWDAAVLAARIRRSMYSTLLQLTRSTALAFGEARGSPAMVAHNIA